MKTGTAGATVTFLFAMGAYGQDAAKAPEFEAASIKPAEQPNLQAAMAGGGRITIRMGCNGGPGSDDPGRMVCNSATVRMLMMRAYAVKNYQITGPSWLDSERFDITAKIPPDTTREQFNLMLQKLLADRFGLTLHRESKELPIYALVPGKGAHKLKTPTADDDKPSPMDDAIAAGKPLPMPPPPSGGGGGSVSMMVMRSADGGGKANNNISMTMRSGLYEVTAKKTTLSNLCSMLSNQLGRPVVDQTNIPGEWNFTLEYAPDESMGNGMGMMKIAGIPSGAGGAPGGDTAEPSGAPSLFTAIQSQLGLKLEAKKGPVETIVIDKIEKTPTEN